MLVVYEFTVDVGANHAGDRVELDPEQAQALMDAGLVQEADEAEEEEYEEEPDGDEAGAFEPADASMRAVRTQINQIKRDNKQATQQILNSLKSGRPNLGRQEPSVRMVREEPAIKGLGDLMRKMALQKTGDRNASLRLASYEAEVRKKSPLGANEGTNSQGGYAVVPEWYEEIYDKIREYPHLLDMTDRREIGGDTLNIPFISEASLQDGSRHGGILSYWVAEGSTATYSNPALGQTQAILNTQVITVPITNQLLQDIYYPLEQLVQRQVMNEFLFTENVAVVSGSGTNQPLGILNQPALVTVAKDSNDAASGGPLSYVDLANMYKRLWAPYRPGAVYLVSQEQYAHLLTMTFPNGASTSVFPAYGLSFDARDDVSKLRFFGLPVIEMVSLSAAPGQVGDVILANLSQLICAEKKAMQIDVSDQFLFTSLQTVFRFVRRYDIRCPWASALTPYSGSTNSYSPFVVLGSRNT